MLELREVSRRFGPQLALAPVSLALAPGRTLGLIGESGSGKSTLARIALRLLAPTTGEVLWEGAPITALHGRALRPFRQAVQPVFQDSAGALDPRLTVAAILAEPLRLRGLADDGRIDAALARVGLDPALRARRPRELSGGQRQRVGIARALLMEPGVLVLDEPVSALDVSVQALVLNLLADLQAERGLAYLFIGHDLSVARFFCDDVIVLQRGEVRERGPAAQVLDDPQHPYTQALLAAAG